MNKSILLLSVFICCGIQSLFSDDVDDLVEVIMQSSPNEKMKADAYFKSKIIPKKQKDANLKTNTSKTQEIPSVEVPEDQLFDVAAKFPKDIVGKYIYGNVIINYIGSDKDDFYLTFYAKNNRGFVLFVKDPLTINRLLQYKIGDTLVISKKNPLKIYHRTFTAAYWVKLPYE
jgi:hypothetical protein